VNGVNGGMFRMSRRACLTVSLAVTVVALPVGLVQATTLFQEERSALPDCAAALRPPARACTTRPKGVRRMGETPVLRALVIDDEPEIRDLLIDMLKVVASFETVDVADSGAAGLALFARHRYDLVVTDFLMPGFTGAQIVEALQQRDPAVKVVMFTGSAMEGDVARVRERGVTVLAKPVSLDRFTAVIGQVLAGKASDAEHGDESREAGG
jgi:two-component system, chemotaxis family, chemotaxis protein CheY